MHGTYGLLCMKPMVQWIPDFSKHMKAANLSENSTVWGHGPHISAKFQLSSLHEFRVIRGQSRNVKNCRKSDIGEVCAVVRARKHEYNVKNVSIVRFTYLLTCLLTCRSNHTAFKSIKHVLKVIYYLIYQIWGVNNGATHTIMPHQDATRSPEHAGIKMFALGRQLTKLWSFQDGYDAITFVI